MDRLIVRSGRHDAETRGLPDDIATPNTARVGPAKAGGRSSSLQDVVREHRVGGAEPIRAAGLEVVALIVDERVECDFTVVRPVVARERSAVGDFSVTVADINAGSALEVVAKDLMAVAENPHAASVAEIIAVDEAFVAVPQREFASWRIDHRVVAICVRARFVGNRLVLTSASDEEVVFDQAVAVREA